jgi:hypothetical protein
MLSSTILYNTTSSVSEANIVAFAKAPATNANMLLVNDCSIFGFIPLVFAMYSSLLKFAIHNNQWENNVDFALIAIVILLVPFFVRYFIKNGMGVALTTHYALYGGLMSSEEVIPEGETSGWATRWAPEEVGGYLNQRVWVKTQFKDDEEFREKQVQAYAKTTDGIRAREGLGGGGGGGEEQEVVALVSTVLAAKKRRSSFDKGEWGVGR